ncbi:lipid IV(A) 3-deoxy-D-manno-octulosonic acid transferase [Sulfurospirillum sp. 1612]|uniref:lipid IV(A) 3-deoxy-D-manno-octulosonic acid transferase n=1 Tax=Sulfurospirillum sp. 1612 TaxID=3094835 RepID=UPI002F91CE21
MKVFIYYTAVLCLYIIAIPFLLYLSFKSKYHHSIPARFFLRKNPRFTHHDIWFHACSLGEVNSLETIIERLEGYDVDLSVTTQTGYNRAKNIKNCDVRYLPFEIFLPFWISKHKTLVVTEAELWPLLFYVAKAKGIKTILLNARISDHSYHSYKNFSWFYRWVFAQVDKVFAQSEEDENRLRELGARDVEVLGNIKTFSQPKVSKTYAKPDKKVITIASSHEGEEALILESLKQQADEMLLVVPRHPERFKSVEVLLREYAKRHHLSFSKLSDSKSVDADVVLCDKMGELINLYPISDVVLLCGSFIDGVGGHNPLEPAFFEKKIISGPFVFNQKALFKKVSNIRVCSLEELGTIDFSTIKHSKILQSGALETLLQHITGEHK